MIRLSLVSIFVIVLASCTETHKQVPNDAQKSIKPEGQKIVLQDTILKMSSDELCQRITSNIIYGETLRDKGDIIVRGKTGSIGRNGGGELTVCIYEENIDRFVICCFQESEKEAIAKIQHEDLIEVAGIFDTIVKNNPVLSYCYLYAHYPKK